MSVSKPLIALGVILGMAAAALLLAVPALGAGAEIALRGGLTAAVTAVLFVVTGLVFKDADGIRRGD